MAQHFKLARLQESKCSFRQAWGTYNLSRYLGISSCSFSYKYTSMTIEEFMTIAHAVNITLYDYLSEISRTPASDHISQNLHILVNWKPRQALCLSNHGLAQKMKSASKPCPYGYSVGHEWLLDLDEHIHSHRIVGVHRSWFIQAKVQHRS